jgi:hypothetical protein
VAMAIRLWRPHSMRGKGCEPFTLRLRAMRLTSVRGPTVSGSFFRELPDARAILTGTIKTAHGESLRWCRCSLTGARLRRLQRVSGWLLTPSRNRRRTGLLRRAVKESATTFGVFFAAYCPNCETYTVRGAHRPQIECTMLRATANSPNRPVIGMICEKPFECHGPSVLARSR